MAIRVNTLGKSAIINRQLNSAYDIVEFVADNLPLLIEACHKIQLIANIDYVKDHVDRDDIHLSQEDRNKINAILGLNSVDINTFNTAITTIQNTLTEIQNNAIEYSSHIHDESSHLSQDEKNLLASLSNVPTQLQNTSETLQNLDSRLTEVESNTDLLLDMELANVAYSGAYSDLSGKPVVDKELDTTSSNAVENKAIAKAIQDKANTDSLHSVAFSGSYNDLINKPVIENRVISGSNNAISSNAVYNLINEITDGSITSIIFDGGIAYITHTNGDVSTEVYESTTRVTEEEIDTIFEE